MCSESFEGAKVQVFLVGKVVCTCASLIAGARANRVAAPAHRVQAVCRQVTKPLRQLPANVNLQSRIQRLEPSTGAGASYGYPIVSHAALTHDEGKHRFSSMPRRVAGLQRRRGSSGLEHSK